MSLADLAHLLTPPSYRHSLIHTRNTTALATHITQITVDHLLPHLQTWGNSPRVLWNIIPAINGIIHHSYSPAQAQSFWGKLEDSTTFCFSQDIVLFIAYLSYSSFSFFRWDLVTSASLTHFVRTTMFTVLYLKLTDNLQDLHIFDTLFSL